MTDARGLSRALATAKPGDSIALHDGDYRGMFVASRPGTSAKPIFLCGGAGAVLDGDGIRGGYVLHLDGASYWRLVGFTARNGQKGVVADHTEHSIIQGLTVTSVGDEGIHLRAASSDNAVTDNHVSRTGLRSDKFGEGVYVGTAQSNWCRYSHCRPDPSNRNLVKGNTITDTKAESVDIKEGTVGGAVIGNSFDGGALAGADSWVDVKGNGWLIARNTGRHSSADGMQTHQVVRGWGTGNLFITNVLDVQAPGWGIHLAPPAGNRVACDNMVSHAANGLSNIHCG